MTTDDEIIHEFVEACNAEIKRQHMVLGWLLVLTVCCIAILLVIEW